VGTPRARDRARGRRARPGARAAPRAVLIQGEFPPVFCASSAFSATQKKTRTPTAKEWPTADVAERIRSFPHWHYEFELQRHKTPIVNRRLINRHRQRREYVMPALLDLLGGTLHG
jgi:hypothetical protein